MGSGPHFSMYLERAGEEEEMRDGWKAGVDGILIFNSSMPFSPPIYAVWVNSLLFLSLVIALTCALLATLLQQWARRNMRVTQPRYNPHKRGLVMYLFNINYAVFKAVMSWVGICIGLYACITFMPIFRHDGPYYAPLSSSAWFIYSDAGASFGATTLRNALAIQSGLALGITKTAEETVGMVSSEMVGRALTWTFESLYEDDELERFFAGIPGFCSSKAVDDPHRSLAQFDSWESVQALEGFLDHTWASNLDLRRLNKDGPSFV
ncbi:hypothetical protein BJV74DRAFT_989152 [Russula compacta]|nr:hypothetical protein BJV74DRAFT_989152 [Russula compacta]